jgi:hypothetical protein
VSLIRVAAATFVVISKVPQMMMHEERSTTQKYLVADAGDCIEEHAPQMRRGWRRG